MPKIEETIEALKEAGVRDQVKIMAGGAPVTQDFIEKIGADAYGANAAAASEKAKALIAWNSVDGKKFHGYFYHLWSSLYRTFLVLRPPFTQ